jgi:large subunit ribosomal protein L16
MLEPKRRKFRKDFRGRRRGIALRGYELAFGEYGLKAMESCWLTSKQIEAGRRAITHSLRRGGRVWIRVFPDKPVTSRPAGQRMGSGKGEIDRYVAVIKPGKILYEIAGASKEIVVEGLKRTADKLPIKTKIVFKEN